MSEDRPWKNLDCATMSDSELDSVTALLRSGRPSPHDVNVVSKAVDAKSLADRVEAQQTKIAELEAKLMAAAATIEKPVA